MIFSSHLPCIFVHCIAQKLSGIFIMTINSLTNVLLLSLLLLITVSKCCHSCQGCTHAYQNQNKLHIGKLSIADLSFSMTRIIYACLKSRVMKLLLTVEFLSSNWTVCKVWDSLTKNSNKRSGKKVMDVFLVKWQKWIKNDKDDKKHHPPLLEKNL